MAPVRQGKRHSNGHGAIEGSRVPLKDSPSTPRRRSPSKTQRMKITAHQNQALIDNLQLEVTERARRLRAQYNLQAQGLRARIEIRVNRIPTSLRKMKMGDLVLKYLQQEQSRMAEERPPPVPAKDTPRTSLQKPPYGTARSPAPGRAHNDMGSDLAGDKENAIDNAGHKLKARPAQGTDSRRVHPVQILSPTSSNSRLADCDRPASPRKPQAARSFSPFKTGGASRSAAVAGVLSSMVERARSTRNAGTRKVTTTSVGSSSSSGTATMTRSRRPAAVATSKAATSRPATRAGRRVSGTSETSESSTGTVVRRAAATKAAARTKQTTMGAIRKGVTGAGVKKTAAKAAAAPANASGRVLRKRG